MSVGQAVRSASGDPVWLSVDGGLVPRVMSGQGRASKPGGV